MARSSQNQRCDFKEAWQSQKAVFLATGIAIAILAFSLAATVAFLLGYHALVDFVVGKWTSAQIIDGILGGLIIAAVALVIIAIFGPTLGYLACKARQLAQGDHHG